METQYARPRQSSSPLDPAFWRDAYARPETRPFLALLDYPAAVVALALPVAADCFPAFPCDPNPEPPADPSSFAAWQRQDNHAFSRWDWRAWTEPPPRGYAAGIDYSLRRNVYFRRRGSAFLMRDVREILVPAAAGALDRGAQFQAAALDALDRLIARQLYRDVAFMVGVQDRLANGDPARLLSLLPRSSNVLLDTKYTLVRPLPLPVAR